MTRLYNYEHGGEMYIFTDTQAGVEYFLYFSVDGSVCMTPRLNADGSVRKARSDSPIE